MDPQQLESIAAMLGVVGRLHREPPGDTELGLLRALVDQWPLDAAPDSDAGLELWRASADAGEDAAQIRADHDRLYGVAAKAVVAPFESVQREKDRLVFGQATHQVRDAYARLGLQAPELNREPDDHVGLELDFLSQALLLARDAADAGDAAASARILDAAADFLREHPRAWVPDVMATVRDEADTAFMRGLALLTRAVLDAADRSLPARD
ncbi:dehydrogenase [Propioniciclava coleopterorum]|uniref:Dehydrogenase n=1 Tax=Propioniciclava coleopterorum TaxID=2714937 RepID=A0A6G7Y7K4_9ACTN|nr:molecular chaperone TorD family protein [Propioniciclava coleopterorum]QIK72628.1 dehydrogenase [Propioniciclava coleopterorum]